MLIGENPHGGDIYCNKVKYDFSANISPLGTPTDVLQAIQRCSVLAYPDPYCAELRNALAREHHVNAEYIFCANGAAEAIFTFALALKPKTALIVTPTFCEYEKALNMVGTRVEHFKLCEKHGFALTENIIQNIKDETDCVFICNPNNPTGLCYAPELIAKIIKHCEKTNTILFLDECFYDFTGFENSAIEHLSKNLCVLKAFTKMYGMAGVRLGYMITENKDLLQKMSNCVQTWNVSSVAQSAGLEALECCHHKEQTIELVKIEREYMFEELSKMGLCPLPSAVNFILFKCEKPLYEPLLRKKILIRRAGNFMGLDDTYYRVAVKTHRQNVALITAIKNILWN